ncbi:transglycosylase SLT domain-containing protein [Prevotella sp. oral taxon 475]|uniref:lytic transglycosylase domain-containing protein n=1 Tax=Prevotella sp. oral taxon 475 TaxID=712471 RepID=UPI001BA8B3CC|nr:lytic transglycosylase domain-containing protein [Prevotella sp. oral taxon 475]QUB47817.1 transglycosylase SLT domain-containing protein [Prevotella sp. oral taxon 475]
MKRKTLLIALLPAMLAMPAIAQTTDDEKEITVTTASGKNEVIDLPEGMMPELDSLLQLYNAKKYLRVSTDCNLPDVNPTFPREVFVERLSRLPTLIEMPYNEVVQKFIDRYSSRLRRSVSYMLGASNFYLPIFEQALESYGLPLELKYLPIIESALNPKAVSHVGATGLWQFMLATGKQYGLEVNSLVDERCDIVKSSYAAAHYLSDLYRIFGDWNLVIAAYNAGPDNINKAIHRAKGERDYWKIYPYLPRETRGYVPAFIAANYIMTYYCEHNICPMTATLPIKTDTVVVNRDLHFEQISAVLNLELTELRSLNPQYRTDLICGASAPCTLRLPSTAVNRFIDRENDIYAYNAADLLARRKEVSVTEPAPVYTPPRRSSTRSRRSRHRHERTPHAGRSVTIRQGDTLSQIAARNHTTVKQLKKLNNISGSSIRAGKKLKVK